MGQSVKAILQLAVVVSVIAAILVWVAPYRVNATDWAFRFALPALVLGLGYVLVRDSRRKDILPDLLREKFARYFECDGLCFGVAPAVIDGAGWMLLFVQNRYEKACSGRIVIQPPAKFLGLGKSEVPGIDLAVECDGGAFELYQIPWPMPQSFGGRKVKFQVAASCSYPSGRGKLMRFRDGMRVGTPGGGAVNAAVTGGLLLIGVIHISKPASISFVLPSGITRPGPHNIPVVHKTLWRPDLPTGGFPVVMGVESK
jgi:hypothetical protein